MELNLVEASIVDLQYALSTRSITSVELAAKYLLRIFNYDVRGPCLNSIPILNQDIFDQAAASDERRRKGKSLGLLDGMPYTLKDSMKYQGMTCASGSPALLSLTANEHSFVAEQLSKAGAVCVGRTNTPPMMASGMHRGAYGRAESPYNLDYLTAAFSSGSSNGSATSTAASFAAFGVGSETVSSGRSPASNNGLVAYTPSRGMISPRGVWPLYPTCDVIVPHTRTIEDMVTILDFLTTKDETKHGDFWREQEFVHVPEVVRPASFRDILTGAKESLEGKLVAVPKMYIGGEDPKAKPTVVSQDVINLWHRAKIDLEALGARVVQTGFPLVTNYEDDSVTGETNNVVGFQTGWNGKERSELVAYLWDDFLRANADPKFPGLACVNGEQVFPRPPDYIPDRYMEHKNFMNYPSLIELARKREGKSIWDIEGLASALPALEAQRVRDLENWIDSNGIDLVVFPANGDVGKADVDTNDESARHALRNGVKYSNGNRAIRHMGVPTVSVCMGIMKESSMPVNLTFAGKHGQDTGLLRYAYAFEQCTRHRMRPPVTPPLPSDAILILNDKALSNVSESVELRISFAGKSNPQRIRVEGEIEGKAGGDVQLEAFVDGSSIAQDKISVSDGRSWSLESDFIPFMPSKPLYGGVGLVVGKITVVILARSAGAVSGKLILIDKDGQ